MPSIFAVAATSTMHKSQPVQQSRAWRLAARWRRFARHTWVNLRAIVSPGELGVFQRNARYLEIEVFWAALLAGAAAFNAPFALRLGASNSQIGLLSSIPALLTLLITLPAGRFLSRQARRLPWTVWSLFLARVGYVLVALLPWLPGNGQGTVLIWLLIAFAAPSAFFGVTWNVLLAEAIPERERARVFAMRNIISAAGVTASIFLAGRWLNSAPYPGNYQILYAVGLIGGALSTFYITRLRLPDSIVPRTPREPVRPAAVLRAARQAVTAQPDFFRLVLNTLGYGVGLWMIGPLYVLYFVRTLGANEGWLGLNGTIGNLTPVLGYYLWQRGIGRWGEKRVLAWTIGLVGLYPLLVGLTPNLAVILVFTALNGLLAPGTNLSHFNMLLKVCPADQRPIFLGLWTSLMNMGAFIMPLIGVALANTFGFAPVLVAGGIICLVGSSSFRWHQLQTPDSLATRRAEMEAGAN
jgi:MFS family permease